MIDDVFFFDEALTGAQVEAIRVAGVPEPSTLGLLALGSLALLRRGRRRS